MRKAGVKLGKDVAVPVGTFRIKGLEDKAIYDPATARKEVALEALAKIEKCYSEMPTDGLRSDACFEIGALLHFDIPTMRRKLQSRDSQWRFQFVELWNRHARLALTLHRDTMSGRNRAKAIADKAEVKKHDPDPMDQRARTRQLLLDGKSYAHAIKIVAHYWTVTVGRKVSERTIRRRTEDLRPPAPVDLLRK
jgi:hypothetical protein